MGAFLLKARGTSRDGRVPCRVVGGMSGDAEVPGRFGARGGFSLIRRLIQTAVMSMERCWTSAANSPKITFDRRKVDYRVQGSADTLGWPRAKGAADSQPPRVKR